jgi:hypothetical protein
MHMDLLTRGLAVKNYQMPRPMSTIPIANHPTTPTEMIVSSVMPEPDDFSLGFESDSTGFIAESKSVITEQLDAEIEQGSCRLLFEMTDCIVARVEERPLINMAQRQRVMIGIPNSRRETLGTLIIMELALKR